MTSSLSHLYAAHVFAAAEEHTNELPMPPIAFGALAMVAFLVLLGVLWAFRGTANKIAGGAHGVHTAPGHHADHVGDPYQGGHH